MFVKALSIIHPLLFCKVMWGENFVLCQTKPVCMSVCGVGVRVVYAHELRFLFSRNKNCLPLKKTIMIFMMSK